MSDERLRPTSGPPRAAIRIVCLGALAIGFAVASLLVGSGELGPGQVMRGLLAHDSTSASIIVWQLRLPRTLLAVLIGAALAVAGTVIQALTRNPLAEPGLLGINAGAALAVVTGIAVFGGGSALASTWFALVGAACAALLVFVISTRRSRASPTRLLLAGVALGASLSALTGIVILRDATAFTTFNSWVVGSLTSRGMDVVGTVAPFLTLGFALALLSGRTLNVLTLGTEQATSLGIPVRLAVGAAVLSVTLLCGAATAAVGPISFIGLVVPHVSRLIWGADQRRILVSSLVLGPALLLAADIVGRIISFPGEIEAGIVTAFLGAPVLLFLIARRAS